VRHIVLFRYKNGVSDNQKLNIVERFLSLKNSLRNGMPYILSIEEGMQNSGEDVHGGFHQAFLMTFSSEGDRNYYVGRPIVSDTRYFDIEHRGFVDFVTPFLDVDGVLVFDYTRNTLV
jgi:hypothetical protein